MPIWDNYEATDRWTGDTAHAIKCPACGTNLVFDAELGKSVCRNCGRAYDPETMELAYQLDKKDQGEAAEEEALNHEIICNSCGASVVTDKNTSATFCAFCGSPALISKRLTKQFRPDCIIPFKVTREEAKKKFREFAKKKKNAPKSFRSEATLKKVTGLYVPFWLIDGVCHADVDGIGKKIRGDGVIEKYNVHVNYDFRVRGVPFDGSKQISDRLMEAIEPFDYSELKPFNNAFLPGFYAERYNLSALNMSDRISRRLDIYAGQYAGVLCPEYDEFKVQLNTSYADGFEQKYALLPVWFLNYEYRGLKYSFAVNGQTGEVDGDMPVSVVKEFFKKAMYWSAIMALPAALIIFIAYKIIVNIAGIKAFAEMFLVPFGFFFLLAGASTAFMQTKTMGFPTPPSFHTGELFEKIVGGLFVKLRDKYDDMSNEINMLLDDAPEVTQYFEAIPGSVAKKDAAFMTHTYPSDEI